MRRFAYENGLSLTFLGLFLAAICLQALAGHADFNEDQARHGDPDISLGRYVISSAFAVAVLENWQSEYLQFPLFVLLTVWLVQRGSPESKELGKAGGESDRDQKIGARPGGLPASGEDRRTAPTGSRRLSAGCRVPGNAAINPRLRFSCRPEGTKWTQGQATQPEGGSCRT